jgi:hypothetical protein
MKGKADKKLREDLIDTLTVGGAHVSFNDAIAGLPATLRGKEAPGLPHTPWMLLEHIRIAQWDILEYITNPKHKSPKWPEGFWPKNEALPSTKAWNDSVATVRKDLKAAEKLVNSKKTDLLAPVPWAEGQTILRKMLLIADHTAYHVAQLVDVRRALGAWDK